MALTDTIEMPRRTMVVFFIIETSGRMKGNKIAAVNNAVRELIPGIRDLSDAEIKIAVLKFSSGAMWLTPNGPVEAEKFNWTNLDAGGNADLGAAFRALDEKLSQKGNGFIADVSISPAIFLFSDGKPTDDWRKELDTLKQNNWSSPALRIAIPVGPDADRDVLAAFTGTKELVFEDFNPEIFRKLLDKRIFPTGIRASLADERSW